MHPRPAETQGQCPLPQHICILVKRNVHTNTLPALPVCPPIYPTNLKSGSNSCRGMPKRKFPQSWKRAPSGAPDHFWVMGWIDWGQARPPALILRGASLALGTVSLLLRSARCWATRTRLLPFECMPMQSLAPNAKLPVRWTIY